MRIGVARLWHEANSFSLQRVGRPEFESREWLRGDSVMNLFRNTATEIGGAIAWSDLRDDVELVISRCASAPPGGMVIQTILDEITDEIVEDPGFYDIDGLYISLHGACIGSEDESPETTLLRRLRKRFPNLPIAASFDMHCCPTQELIATLNVATVYRTYPHIDMDLAAIRALEMLASIIEQGRQTWVVMATADRVFPSFNMRTDTDGPMSCLEMFSEQLEKSGAPEVLAVYPYASFAFADIPATNAGALVTTTNPEKGRVVAKMLSNKMYLKQAEFCPALESAAVCLSRRPWNVARRIAILDPADNPLSGGSADTPGLLATALLHDLPDGSVFAFFHAPDTVKQAKAAGVGAQLTLQLGAQYDNRFGSPIECIADVLRLTNGEFVNSGPMEKGITVRLGDTALLKIGQLQVIITSNCQGPNDAGYFWLHGIDINEIPLLFAKAKNHFYAAFSNSFDEIIQVDSPGPAMADVTALPFSKIPLHRFKLENPSRDASIK